MKSLRYVCIFIAFIIIMQILILLIKTRNNINILLNERTPVKEEIAAKKIIETAKRNVFIDLGANKGDSVLNFIGSSNKAQGGNINNEIFSTNKNKKWIIYAFEANKVFDESLDEMKKKATDMNHVVHLYKQTAAWIYDGKIDFYLDTVNKAQDYWGSSLKKDHSDVIKSNLTKVVVDCVDIANLIKLYEEADTIVVKMDIEGAEYDLLQDFIKKDAMKLIDYIAIEFHGSLSPFKSPNDVFISLVKLLGVKFLDWN